MNIVNPIKNAKDIEAMKKALVTDRNRLLFIFGINSALRISDILEVKVGDVIGENGKPVESLTVKETKTRKAKTFELNQSIIDELRKLKYSSRGEYLFPSRKGENKAITRVQAYRILNDAARAIGLKDPIGTHTLRKTFGYHAHVTHGVSLSTLQKILNHSSQRETLCYIGITQETINDVYRAVCL